MSDKTAELQAMDIFLAIAERCAREFGAPLPKRLLVIGDMDSGWGVKFNASLEKAEGVEPLCAAAFWNGWPAGMVSPAFGGFIAAGEAANAASLVAWCNGSESPTP
jgi:hypothetical protein